MILKKLQKEFLSSAGQKIAPEDFFVLLAHATNKDKTFLFAHPEYELDTRTETKAREYFSRRAKHEPVAYVVGHKEFYGRDFQVTPATLIPRPETELLIELILEKIKSDTKRRPSTQAIFLTDIGTGSGNIVVTLAKEIKNPTYTFHATDISSKALNVAKKNAKRHNVENIISFYEGNFLDPLKEKLVTANEIIIVANLPYLSEKIWQSAEDDVKIFEPKTALVSAQVGLDHYYRLFDQVKSLNTDFFRDREKSQTSQKQSVMLFLEISPEQTPLIKQYFSKNFPKATFTIHPDLSSRDRVVVLSL
ncbi:MAG: peptide chain release factor N(5)-glutamine methyltransferase [Candidatus Moranbacteria bacterium]|nr:peptide chain release factor N(5)-glutamine methyltransferase [Candidatus Moranbacteria bacterium]